MALMRFRSKPRPRPVVGQITSDDRQPEHLGDVPPVPPKPETARWSISSYPYPEPAFNEEGGEDD